MSRSESGHVAGHVDSTGMGSCSVTGDPSANQGPLGPWQRSDNYSISFRASSTASFGVAAMSAAI